MTTSLSSSLDLLSLASTTTWASDSLSDEDEIVWSLSSSAHLSNSPPLHSPLSETMDFVLVPRATAVAAAAALSASPAADTIAEEMAALSLTPTARGSANSAGLSPSRTSVKRAMKAKLRHQAATTTAEQQQQQQQPAPPTAPKKKGKKAKKRVQGSSSSSTASSASSSTRLRGAAAASSPDARPSRTRSAGKSPAKSPTKKSAGSSTGLGTRAVVDDSVSETSESSSATAAGYQEAQKYMTSYLAHPPPPGNNGSALLVLQALILELGCLPSVAAGKFSIPQLPATLRQAKLLLKSHAFINVRDYLAVREQGQDALQRVMHPNRKSLVKEVRKGKRMPVGEIKKAGLNVLLVHTHS